MYGYRPLSVSPVLLDAVRELHPVHDDVPDTRALREPLAGVERVMDPRVEAGACGFLRSLIKGGKCAGGLRRHEVMIAEEGIGEGHDPKHVREHPGGGARLNRMARGVGGEARCDEEGTQVGSITAGM